MLYERISTVPTLGLVVDSQLWACPYMENVQAAAPDGSPVCTGSCRTVCRAFSLLLSSQLQFQLYVQGGRP